MLAEVPEMAQQRHTRPWWKGVARLALSLIRSAPWTAASALPGARLAPLPLPQGSSSNSTAFSQQPGPEYTEHGETRQGPGTQAGTRDRAGWAQGVTEGVGGGGVSEKLEAGCWGWT